MTRLSKPVSYMTVLYASATAAVLAVSVVIAVYRLFMPVGIAGDIESMVAKAIEEVRGDGEEAVAEQYSVAGNIAGDSDPSGEEAGAEQAPVMDNAAADSDAFEVKVSRESDDDSVNESVDQNDLSVQKGVSHGDYRIFDPNADYITADDIVTAREGTVNVRTGPRTDGSSEVIIVLREGECLRRTAIGENGWSKLEYEGQTFYAVTEYLRTIGSVPKKRVE
jgi:hypothetical protein